MNAGGAAPTLIGARLNEWTFFIIQIFPFRFRPLKMSSILESFDPFVQHRLLNNKYIAEYNGCTVCFAGLIVKKCDDVWSMIHWSKLSWWQRRRFREITTHFTQTMSLWCLFCWAFSATLGRRDLTSHQHPPPVQKRSSVHRHHFPWKNFPTAAAAVDRGRCSWGSDSRHSWPLVGRWPVELSVCWVEKPRLPEHHCYRRGHRRRRDQPLQFLHLLLACRRSVGEWCPYFHRKWAYYSLKNIKQKQQEIHWGSHDRN